MIPSGTISPELEDKVNRELESDERVLWMEQPVPRYFTAMSTGMFLFAIPWTAFAVFWICGASGFEFPDFRKGGFAFFPLFGLPFLLIGVGMLTTPIWTRRKAAKTVYVITDRRAITFDGGWTTTIRSYPPDKLQNLFRKEKSDGTGDIILAQRAWADSEGHQQAMDLGFLNIRDPKTVENMLKKLAEKGTEPRR